MKNLFYLTGLFALYLFISSCEESTKYDLIFPNIPFESLYQNTRYPIYPDVNNFVIYDKNQEDTFFKTHKRWKESPIIDSLPRVINNIDYNQYMVIICHKANTSSGSIKLSISSIKELKNEIQVNTELFIPIAGTDDIGHPVHFVKVKKSNKPIIFTETTIKKEF